MSDMLLLLALKKNSVLSAVRTLFAAIDWAVYNVIALLFRALFRLSNFEIYGLFEEIEDRVFVILGIFMLFKVTVSFITYLVNPDKISDKEQGVSKVVIRIITVLVMLMGLPTFFSLMSEAQNKFLPVVPRIILGTPYTMNGNDTNNMSEFMALSMLQSFTDIYDGCDNSKFSSLNSFLNNINDACGMSVTNVSGIIEYKYNYLAPFSTITGVIMCYVIFSLCINVSIRSFKLILLRAIAPIPIISYIDPKSAKDGAFSAWTKTFFSTWAELFIQIGLVYFIVFVIDFALTKDTWKQFFGGVNFGFIGVFDSTVLLVFLIIGLLMFAKQAPKFICDALGIKSSGNFMRMLGMGTTALGGVGAARAAFRARQEFDDKNGRKSFLRGLGNAGASLFSGMGAVAAGGNALLTANNPSLMTGFDAQSKHNASMLARVSNGSTLGGRIGAFGQTLLSGETSLDRKERNWKAAEEQIGYDKKKNAELKTIQDRASSKGLESLKTSANIEGQYNGRDYKLDNVNAASFASWASSVESGNGVMRDTIYTDKSGNRVSADDYNNMLSKRDTLESTINSYTKKTTGNYYDALGNIITDRNVLLQIESDPNYAYLNGISYQEKVEYTNANGNTISETDYKSMVDSYNESVEECDNINATEGDAYAMYKGEKIYVDDIGLLKHDIDDGNIADYALRGVTEEGFDSVIEGANARYASANDNKGVEDEFIDSNGDYSYGLMKKGYGDANNDISRREMEIANDKNSTEVSIMRANQPSNGSKK